MSDRQLVAHLLRRATFGPTAAEVDAAERAGVDATVTALLAPAGADPGAAATPAPDLGPDPYAALGRGPTRDQRQAAQQAAREQLLAVEAWWLARMAAAKQQFPEKLVFFWHGHWATSAQKVRSGPLMLRQLTTFRTAGRGDFVALVKAMLRDPALIIWLDGQRNTRKVPNENLARELMELFTLGIGAYTEDDVKAGARALTGWAVDRAAQTANLVPNRHDPGPKTILGVTKNFDIDSYADLLVAQPANAAFLSRRLWYRFGTAEPIDPAVQARLVAAYRPGRDVTALARALFTDPAFPGTRGRLVKQPIEWLIGAIRQLGIDHRVLAGDKQRQYLGALDALGQVPLRPPSVGGWPAGAAWLTTAALQVRLTTATLLATQAAPAVLEPLGRGSTDARLDGLARLLVVDAWTDRTREAIGHAGNDPRKLLAAGLASPEYTVS